MSRHRVKLEFTFVRLQVGLFFSLVPTCAFVWHKVCVIHRRTIIEGFLHYCLAVGRLMKVKNKGPENHGNYDFSIVLMVIQ